MDSGCQECHYQNCKCKAEKSQTDLPTKLRELAREQSTTASVNSLHETAAVGEDCCFRPDSSAARLVRQASLSVGVRCENPARQRVLLWPALYFRLGWRNSEALINKVGRANSASVRFRREKYNLD